MMRTKANLRDTGLDVICGLLVLHMILGHIFSNFCGIEDSVFYYWEERLLFFFMPWFFFKNGMFFKPKTEQKTFIKRDFRRFMIPFIIWSAIGEIIRWIDVALSANATSIAWYAASIKSLIVKGMILGNAPLWFLLSLFIVRIIFNAAMRVRQLPLALTLASICFAYMCWKLDFNWMVSVSHALLGFFCFGCGYFLKEKQRSIHVVALAGMSLFAITAISPTYIRMCSNTMAYGSCYFVGIVAAIASIVLINNILPPPHTQFGELFHAVFWHL